MSSSVTNENERESEEQSEKEPKTIIDRSTENGKDKLLNENEVDVDILPKVGGNSIVINICSCFNWNYSDTEKKK